jgi:hypothetical protein
VACAGAHAVSNFMTWADYVDDVFRNAQPVCSHGNHTQAGGHDTQIFLRGRYFGTFCMSNGNSGSGYTDVGDRSFMPTRPIPIRTLSRTLP